MTLRSNVASEQEGGLTRNQISIVAAMIMDTPIRALHQHCFKLLTLAQCRHSVWSQGPNCSCEDDVCALGVCFQGVCSQSASQGPCCFCVDAFGRAQKAPCLRELTPHVEM